MASIELWWLPLGAGGRFVRLNGRVYEAVHALLERRRPLELYHCALEVRVPDRRFVIENARTGLPVDGIPPRRPRPRLASRPDHSPPTAAG